MTAVAPTKNWDLDRLPRETISKFAIEICAMSVYWPTRFMHNPFRSTIMYSNDPGNKWDSIPKNIPLASTFRSTERQQKCLNLLVNANGSKWPQIAPIYTQILQNPEEPKNPCGKRLPTYTVK